MSSYQRALQLVYDAIDIVNETLEPEQRLTHTPDTVLLGEGGNLDSLGFVNFAVTVEEGLERDFGQNVSVMEIVTASERGHWTVADLAERIAACLAPGAA